VDWNDTWSYDPSKKEWTELNPAFNPPPRSRHTSAYDSANDLVVVHGGRKPSDTWAFDAKRNCWFEIAPKEQPPDGVGQMEYDPGNKCFIARNPDRSSGEIWVLRIQPAGAAPPPPAPEPAGAAPWQGAWAKMKGRVFGPGGHIAAAFDTKHGQYVAIWQDRTVMAYSLAADKSEVIYKPGPGDDPGLPKELWEICMLFDPGREEMLIAAHSVNTLVFSMADRQMKKTGRGGSYMNAAMAHGEGQFLMLYSGSSADLHLCSWDAAKQAWEEIKCKLPPGRSYPGEIMVCDPPRKRFLMFSGTMELNDTWTFDPARREWTELRPAASPPPHRRHTMCYDPENDLIVVSDSRPWVFDAKRNSWFEIVPKSPAPERAGQIEYDPANKCCIARNPNSGEVWVLRISPAAK
jgi:hypothetical protein